MSWIDMAAQLKTHISWVGKVTWLESLPLDHPTRPGFESRPGASPQCGLHEGRQITL